MEEEKHEAWIVVDALTEWLEGVHLHFDRTVAKATISKFELELLSLTQDEFYLWKEELSLRGSDALKHMDSEEHTAELWL
jgi:hypothetical protein